VKKMDIVIKDILINKCGFEKKSKLKATGSARLVKKISGGARVHVKEIKSEFLTYDIDLDDPEQSGHLLAHAKATFNWIKEGTPDKTKKVKLKVIKKKRCSYNWLKEYEKDFKRVKDSSGFEDWVRKVSIWQRIKNFFSRKGRKKK